MAFDIPPVIQGLLGLVGLDGAFSAPASWKDRLKEAAYTSPSGTRIKFTYEDVSRTTPKRSTAFEFPEVDGAYVQDNGHGARQYPLDCIFWGDNCDRIATAFELALFERGAGRLEHPLYGPIDVVPFGDIVRNDPLKTAANQSIVSVTFLSTIGAVYPSAEGNPKSEVLAALGDFDVEAANQFQNAVQLPGTTERFGAIATVRKLLNTVSGALGAVAATTTAVNREFRDLQQAINFGMDVLIGQPLALALQISNLIKAPARALAGLQSRLESYQRLARSIIGSSAGSGASDSTQLARLKLRTSNDFHIADLFAMNAAGGSILSALETDYETRTEALLAASAILDQLDEVVVWREARSDGLGQVDLGDSYRALQNAAALAAGYLIQESFSLVQERRIVLDRARTIVDLAAELYGSVDDRLDLLINSNNLSGDEILELPAGRVIAYYP